MSYDPSAQTPQMTISVTLGEFHSTHERAAAARKKVHTELSTMNVNDLKSVLTDLQAGQRLSDAEDGPDFMYASDYNDEIWVVERELDIRQQ